MRVRSLERPRFSATGATRAQHPNESTHNRIVYRLLEQVLSYAAGRYARGRLVDVGCGAKPWRHLFAPYVEEHVGVDHVPSKSNPTAVDVLATAYEIPLADRSVDTVLMTSVMEHLERPEAALRECRRLLKPGGHLIMTAPFFWHVHDAPRDFFRYAPDGLRYLLESSELEVLELQPLAGAWTTLSIQVSYALRRYRKPGVAVLVDAFTRGIQWLAPRWDQVDFQPKFSWSHLAVARRPPDGAAVTPALERSASASA